MQKKKDKDGIFIKIVKKDYNNELEKILDEKHFSEDVKNMLLNILYKIDLGYLDYKEVKRDVDTKEEIIKRLIYIISKNCEKIEVLPLNVEKSNIKNETKTYKIDKKHKKITVIPIERKLLYVIYKLKQNDEILKEENKYINKAITDLINVGNAINNTEIIRDFNGYSWVTLVSEIESTAHNLIYQNIRILIGNKFLDEWVESEEYIIDYYESIKNKLEHSYTEINMKLFIKLLEELAILLLVKYDKNIEKNLIEEKNKIIDKLEELENREKFIEKVSKTKKQILKKIKNIDEVINTPKLLEKEYLERNKNLDLENKIFSIKVLAKTLKKERDTYLNEIEKLSNMLIPKKFVSFERELKRRKNYLKYVDNKNREDIIYKKLCELQKIFIDSYKIKIEKAINKEETMNLIYELRYYIQIYIDKTNKIYEAKELKEEIQKILIQIYNKLILNKKNSEILKDKDFGIYLLKEILKLRVMKLEEIEIKFNKEENKGNTKEKKYYMEIIYEDQFEEKIDITEIISENEKIEKLIVSKLNKKIKIFE